MTVEEIVLVVARLIVGILIGWTRGTAASPWESRTTTTTECVAPLRDGGRSVATVDRDGTLDEPRRVL